MARGRALVAAAAAAGRSAASPFGKNPFAVNVHESSRHPRVSRTGSDGDCDRNAYREKSLPQRLVVLAAWPHPPGEASFGAWLPRGEATFGALLCAGLDCSVDFLPGKVDRSALAGADLAFVLLHGSCDRTSDPIALIQGITDICPVLAVGEERDICAITKLIEAGIADFIIQPCPSQEVVMRARRALGTIHPRSRRRAGSSLAGNLAAHRLIGTSPAFARGWPSSV